MVDVKKEKKGGSLEKRGFDGGESRRKGEGVDAPADS